jgi:methylphosphotriester-DNA--protein-cysteine methyltransferase
MHRTNELAAKTQMYIEANFKPLLTVKEVACAMGVCAPDLNRLFRRANGITIKKYIDAKCKEAILEKLKASGCKGCALANEFGFKTDQAFYRWIKRVFGVRFGELSVKYGTATTEEMKMRCNGTVEIADSAAPPRNLQT